MSRGELVGSLLGGTALNYIGHMACACGVTSGEKKEQEYMEMEELARQKELVGGQDRKRLHRATIFIFMAMSCLGRNSGITSTSDMGLCLRTSPLSVMVVVRSS